MARPGRPRIRQRILNLDESNAMLDRRGGQITGKALSDYISLRARVRVAKTPRALFRAINRMNERALRAAGSATQQIARASMKDEKAKSLVGFPPHAHTKGGLKKGPNSVQFEVYPPWKPTHVVIGPRVQAGNQGVPKALEYGGMATINVTTLINPKTGKVVQKGEHRGPRPSRSPGQRARVKSYYSSLNRKVTKRQVRRQPYPYMRPAFTKLGAKNRFWFRMLRRVA